MQQADGQQDYTVPEAARLLRVSAVTIWRWIAAQKLPAYRVGPRNIRVKKADLDHMLQPVQQKEAKAKESVLVVRASAKELARRQSLVRQIMEHRKERNVAPFTTSDLVHQSRKDQKRSYGH